MGGAGLVVPLAGPGVDRRLDGDGGLGTPAGRQRECGWVKDLGVVEAEDHGRGLERTAQLVSRRRALRAVVAVGPSVLVRLSLWRASSAR